MATTNVFSLQELAGLLSSGCQRLEAENGLLREENERLNEELAAARTRVWACEDDHAPSQCRSSSIAKVFISETRHHAAPEHLLNQQGPCEEASVSNPPSERALGSVCRLGPPRPLPLLEIEEHTPREFDVACDGGGDAVEEHTPREPDVACDGGGDVVEATRPDNSVVAVKAQDGCSPEFRQITPHSQFTQLRYKSEAISGLRFSSEGHTQDSSDEDATSDEHGMARRSTSKLSTVGMMSFKIWPEWREANDLVEQQNSHRPSVVMLKAVFAISDEAANKIKAGDSIQDGRCPLLQFLIMQPGCKKRLFWEVVSLLVLIYDIITIPLQAFPIAETRVAATMNLVVTLVWTIDLLSNFLVGYYQDGILEMRPAKVAMKYLASFFVLDLIVVSTDWAIIALEAQQTESFGLVRVGKTLRVSRGLRTLRFIRLFKVASFMQDLDNVVRSESVRTCIGILKLVVAILLVNHYIACAWYALGDVRSNSGQDSWLDQLRFATADDLVFTYTTSLHWSLTQFTPASMEVTPRNAYERAFTIGVIVFALVSFSSFVSSITNAMTHLQRINAQSLEEKLKVRQFILEHQLSFKLANLICTFLRQDKGIKKKRLHANDIEAFRMMPESLKVHLHYELFMPTLTSHPFFRHMHNSESTGFMNICHFAIAEVAAPVGEDVLVYGQSAEATYFVVSGQLCYHPGKHEKSHETVIRDSIVCEMVLWVQWMHRGRLTAESPCDLLKLNAVTFREIMAQTLMWAKCCQYAKHYFQNIIVKEPYDTWFEQATSDWLVCDHKKKNSTSGIFNSNNGKSGGYFAWTWSSF